MTEQFKFKPDTWPDNAIHISLDLETASTASNAAIVQIGAYTSCGQDFLGYASLASCEGSGMDVDVETMQWWSKQDPELRNKVFGSKDHIRDTLYEFIQWCEHLCGGDWKRIYIWGNGADFDCVVLINAIEMFDKSPFEFRNLDHLRTLKRAVPVHVQQSAHKTFITKYPDAKPHDALADAMYQMNLIHHCIVWLKVQDATNPQIL